MTYSPKPLRDEPGPECIGLAHHVHARHFALYVGAGVSKAAPSQIPTASELVRLLNPRLEGEFGIRGLDPTGEPKTLELVGDEAAAGGYKDALKLMISEEPRFVTEPNYGHLVIAAFLREGAANLLTVNWDQCIENACGSFGFHVSPTVTDPDRVGRLRDLAYHKLNGCITRPATLMVTSQEVNEPLPWASGEVQGALGRKLVVFLGVGTVPTYIRRRLEELLSALPDLSMVRVVSRSISPAWQEILGADYASAAIERSADEFLDDLFRAFIRMHLASAEARAAALAVAGDLRPEGIEHLRRLLADLREHDALTVWRWLTRGAIAVPSGDPVIGTEPCNKALLALALLIGATATEMHNSGEGFVVMAGSYYLEICIAPGVGPSMATAQQEARVERRRAEGRYARADAPILHLAIGQWGELPNRKALPHVGWSEDPTSVMTGPSDGIHRWVDGNDILRGYEWDLSA